MLAIFCDFDGTITKDDVVDKLLLKFSSNHALSQKYEEEWRRGKISSKECLSNQVRTIEATERQVRDFLDEIEVENGFVDFARFLEKEEIPFIILSDGFDMFIKEILKKHRIAHYEVHSNRITNSDELWQLHFPHEGKVCKKCAHCKRETIFRYRSLNKKAVYIGDGLSDTHAVEFVDMVFAKGELADYCRRKQIRFAGFKDFFEIKDSLKKIIEGAGLAYAKER